VPGDSTAAEVSRLMPLVKISEVEGVPA
jgi:hypothetical protein